MHITRPGTIAFLSSACGVLLAPLLVASQDGHHGGKSAAGEMKDAGALFRSSCSTCHLPPDPDHETDRAWLTQVKDTA